MSETEIVPMQPSQSLAEVEAPSALPSFPTKSQIDEYQTFLKNYDTFIKSVLNDSVDFGYIPGVKKPSLFKPGAEKLEKLMFLRHEKILVEKILEEDFVKYTYRTVVYDKSGQVKATCEGTCNSKESKYSRSGKSVYELENTIMKMAQKRSYVGAILEATNSSGRFTQDVEDINTDQPQNTQEAPKNEDDSVKKAQLRAAIFELLKKLEKDENWINEKMGKPILQFSVDGMEKIKEQLEALVRKKSVPQVQEPKTPSVLGKDYEEIPTIKPDAK